MNFLADLHEGNNKEYLRATLAEQDKVFNLLRNPDLKEREAEWKEALTGQGGFLLNGLAPNGPHRPTDRGRHHRQRAAHQAAALHRDVKVIEALAADKGLVSEREVTPADTVDRP